MADLKITSRMDSKPFNRGVDKMQTRTKRFSEQVTKLGGAIAGAFAVRQVIRFAAETVRAAGAIEDMQVQFRALGLTTQEAADRMEALADFSAQTPFQLEDIAEASRLLTLFSSNVLGTEESLTLIGDAAAGVGQNLAEVSMWVGRLYAGLQAGAPIGEATMRLMEMGIVAPDVKQKLADMTKAGADSADMWDVVTKSLGKFGGQMEIRSKTINGMVSTMKDNWRLAFAEMGDFLKPTTAGIVQNLTSLAKWLGNTRNELEKLQAAGNGSVIKGNLALSGLLGADALNKAFDRVSAVNQSQENNRRIAEEQAAKKKADAEAIAAEKAKNSTLIKDREAAHERSMKILEKGEKNAIATGKKILAERARAGETQAAEAGVFSAPSDRLAKIGGFLGGSASPVVNAPMDKLTNIQLQVLAEMKRNPQETARALRSIGTLGSV